MRATTVTLILTLAITLLMHLPAIAQHTATAVMTVSVEVVDGSSVEMNQNDLITFDENQNSETVFAIFSINKNQENTILTSASETIHMVNGTSSVEMISILTENRDENGQITLEFSTGNDNLFTGGGYYYGKQIAEIIYL